MSWAPESEPCQWEVAAFGAGSGMLLTGWGLFEQPPTPPLRQPLPGVVEVHVAIWVVTGAEGAGADIAADLDHASRIYDGQRAGIRFALDSVTEVPADHPDGMDKGCRDDMSEWAAPGQDFYAPDAVNVYVIDRFSGLMAGAHGATCFNRDRPNVIFISWEDHSDATLAHELGHTLMLRSDCGHVNDCSEPRCPTIDPRNVMWNGDVDGVVRDRLTLGQVYRMNMDDSSWLNTRDLRGSAPTYRCQTSCWLSSCQIDTPCARITLDAADATP